MCTGYDEILDAFLVSETHFMNVCDVEAELLVDIVDELGLVCESQMESDLEDEDASGRNNTSAAANVSKSRGWMRKIESNW